MSRKHDLANGDDRDQCRRQLDMIIEIDRLRDEIADDPQRLLEAITGALTRSLTANAGLLVLAEDKDTATVTIDPQAILHALDADALRQTIHSTSLLHTPSRLDPDRVLKQAGISHLLASPLSTKGRRLGTLLFMSCQHPFDDYDLDLLAAGASQADSAVIQAQTWQQLTTRNRQLDAVYRVDRIRDQTTDVKQLFIRVLSVLADTLSVEWGAAALLDQERAQVAIKAIDDRANVSPKLDQHEIQHVLDQALDLPAPAPVSAPSSFAANRLNSLFAIPLTIEDEKLGVFVLAASDKNFSPADIDLMHAIAGQTDSAVVYLRALEAAQERNKQLLAIYQIDRIRDETADVQEILSAVSSIIITSLGVDLCLLSLIGEESGKSELKTVQDRFRVFGKLDRDAIERAIDWASHQKQVASLSRGSPFAKWDLGCLMGASLTVGNQVLGSLVMARAQPTFCSQERALLQAIVSQTDSAIVHAHTARRLEQRNKELETLYHVDHIRDQEHDFGAMLSAVLSELCTVIEAEMGFIMLFDEEGRQLELKASTADDILNTSGTGIQTIDQDGTGTAVFDFQRDPAGPILSRSYAFGP